MRRQTWIERPIYANNGLPSLPPQATCTESYALV
jgi:hypothetical protein